MTLGEGGGAHRLAHQWFVETLRWYVEGHQGCPRCRGRHCVFRARWGSRLEFHCTACDFSAAHDEAAGTHTVSEGEPRPTGIALTINATSWAAPAPPRR